MDSKTEEKKKNKKKNFVEKEGKTTNKSIKNNQSTQPMEKG